MDDIIDDNSSSSSNDEPKCSICFEKFNNDEEQLKCSHIFHKKCIDEWTKTQATCPICRYEIEGVQKPSNNNFSSRLFFHNSVTSFLKRMRSSIFSSVGGGFGGIGSNSKIQSKKAYL